MNRKECLDNAIKCVCTDRESQYGTPEYNFNLIANLWTVYKRVHFTAEDVAVMMALLKIARIRTGKPKEDNYIDLAGYAACACELSTREYTSVGERRGEMNEQSKITRKAFVDNSEPPERKK